MFDSFFPTKKRSYAVKKYNDINYAMLSFVRGYKTNLRTPVYGCRSAKRLMNGNISLYKGNKKAYELVKPKVAYSQSYSPKRYAPRAMGNPYGGYKRKKRYSRKGYF